MSYLGDLDIEYGDDNEVEVEVAQGVRVRVVKSTLSDVRPHGAKPAND